MVRRVEGSEGRLLCGQERAEPLGKAERRYWPSEWRGLLHPRSAQAQTRFPEDSSGVGVGVVGGGMS